MADETLIDACDRYLSRTRSSLWGRSHNVIHPRERREAAEWLAQQVEAVQAELNVSSVPIGMAIESVSAGEQVRVATGGRNLRVFDAEEDIAANEFVALCDTDSASVRAFRRTTNGKVT